MKRLFLISAALSILLLASCSNQTNTVSSMSVDNEGTLKLNNPKEYTEWLLDIPYEEMIDSEKEQEAFCDDILDFSKDINAFQSEEPAISPVAVTPLRYALITQEDGDYRVNTWNFLIVDKETMKIVGNTSLCRISERPDANESGGSIGIAHKLNEALKRGKIAIFIDEFFRVYGIYEDNTIIPLSNNAVDYSGRTLSFDEVVKAADYDNIVDDNTISSIVFDPSEFQKKS
jgi:hypothetical protein